MTPRPRIPWREVIVWSLLGTLVVTAAVLLDVRRTGLHAANLIQPGKAGPSVEVVEHDFPRLELPAGLGHDGQQFYAIARAPMHLEEVAEHVDRPTYRLQRPLYAWLAWLIHPTGGGTGLVLAMFTVGLLATFAGSLASGALSTMWGGPAAVAAAFALLPGTYVSLRISTADALALALAIAALALAERRRNILAVLAAVGAILAKEPVLVVLAGYALWRRDRVAVALVAIPTAVAGGWALLVRAVVTSHGKGVQELTWPLDGLLDSASSWGDGENLWALAALAAAAAVGALALARRGLAHPAGWAIAASLVLLGIVNDDVVGLPLNASRAAMAPLLLGIVAVAAPARHARDAGADP